MYEKEFRKLAERVVNYSVDVKPGDKVYIHAMDNPEELVNALVKEIFNSGGRPYIENDITRVKKRILKESTPEEIKFLCECSNSVLSEMDAYIGIRNYENINEYYDVPVENMITYTKYYNRPGLGTGKNKKVHRTILRYPSKALAQMAGMSQESFMEYYFKIILIDFKAFYDYCNVIKDMADNTQTIRIKAVGTELELSANEVAANFGMGRGNMPDGELCTTPDKEKVNGHITFNIPSNYMGRTFKNIYLEFEKGKIVKAASNHSEILNKILDSDPEARYLCEFSIGLHPYINSPIIDTLIDEKMTGSIHFAPAYIGNNPSVIHWDIIQSHHLEYGGGEIWFDDRLIRKDGKFIVKELEKLNPENFSKYIEDKCRL